MYKYDVTYMIAPKSKRVIESEITRSVILLLFSTHVNILKVSSFHMTFELYFLNHKWNETKTIV